MDKCSQAPAAVDLFHEFQFNLFFSLFLLLLERGVREFLFCVVLWWVRNDETRQLACNFIIFLTAEQLFPLLSQHQKFLSHFLFISFTTTNERKKMKFIICNVASQTRVEKYDEWCCVKEIFFSRFLFIFTMNFTFLFPSRFSSFFQIPNTINERTHELSRAKAMLYNEVSTKSLSWLLFFNVLKRNYRNLC